MKTPVDGVEMPFAGFFMLASTDKVGRDKGKYGAYCRNKCGMNASKAWGRFFPTRQVEKPAGREKDACKRFKR